MGLLSSCGAQASHRSGFSGSQASAVVTPWLQSTGSVIVVHSIWDLPGSEIEPVSLALTGRFFTTEPPGKPKNFEKEDIARQVMHKSMSRKSSRPRQGEGHVNEAIKHTESAMSAERGEC